MEKNNYNIALIIDADNISYKYLDTLFAELKNFGRIAYKRIYGDFTEAGKQGWAGVIKENGLVPIQEYACIKGKNTTDIAMVIDAMDILYAKNVDCFCIATSDSDFTRLITRLRESNIFVIGAGEGKANKAFMKNYDRFIILDQLYTINKKEKPAKPAEKKEAEPKAVEKPGEVIVKPEEAVLKTEETVTDGITPKEQIFEYVKDIIDHEESADGWIYLATVMQKLYIQFPEFNCKLYKAKNTRDFFEKNHTFELKQATKNQANDSTMIRNKPQINKQQTNKPQGKK